MARRCDHCGRPATWHAASKTATMPLAFAYACDEHRLKDMVPIDEPLGRLPEHLSARESVDVFYYVDGYREDDVDYEDQVGHSEEIDDEDELGDVDNEE